MKETIDDILTELSCKGWQDEVHIIEEEIEKIKNENEILTNKLIEIYKYEYGVMSDEELLQIIKEIKEDDKE